MLHRPAIWGDFPLGKRNRPDQACVVFAPCYNRQSTSMQDIRPTGKKRPPWHGSTVPVSSISVPPVPPRPVPKQPTTPSDMVPFARTPVKNAIPPKPPQRRWRVGRRERLIMASLLLAALVTGALAAVIF